MIKAIITFVVGNSFWDYLVDTFGSPVEVIAIAVVLVVILFVFNRFRKPQNSAPPAPIATPTARIKAVSGPLKGQEWILKEGNSLTVGRLPDRDIKFPPDENKISRTHCEIKLSNGEVYIKDTNSTHGTFLQNEQRLNLNQWEKVKGNFYPVSKNYMFSIEVHKGK